MAEDTQLHIEKWSRLLVIVSTLLVLTIFVAVVVRLSMYIHHTLLLFGLGALVAYALDPVVEGLRRPGAPFWAKLIRRNRQAADTSVQDNPDNADGRGGMSRGVAITIVFLCVLLLIGFGIYGLSKPLASQVRSLSDQRQQQNYRQRADVFLQNTDSQLGRIGVHLHLHDYLIDPSSIPPQVQTTLQRVEHEALPALRDVAVSLGESFFVLLIALYLLIYSHEMRRGINAQLPGNLLKHAEVWEEDVNRILGGFVRGQLIIALVLGAVSAVVCLLIGIHIWLLIGIFVAIASLIPVFGPYLGAIPAVIAALIGPTHFSNPIWAIAAVLVAFIAINEIGSKVLYPRLVGQAIGLHEVLVLFVIIAGLEIDGITGVLFAAPLTAIIAVTLVHLYRFWLDLPDSLLSVRNEESRKSSNGAGGAASNGETVAQMRSSVEG